ncbi:hypothetical protein B4096_2555 [Heyndrickxia coagulans]|nr:hypothetical protein B4100_2648 [Heyndrickxia coagulans]KYC92322.1 hypothetical protein B4096_2555 [Heyndrickxia coagulans]
MIQGSCSLNCHPSRHLSVKKILHKKIVKRVCSRYTTL